MVTFLQNIEADTVVSQGIGDKTLTDIVYDHLEYIRAALVEIWGVVLDFNVQAKVLLILIIWLFLIIISINIAWRVYCPSIRNPDIPGKLLFRYYLKNKICCKLYTPSILL